MRRRTASTVSSNPKLSDVQQRAFTALEKTERATRTLDGTLKLAAESEEIGERWEVFVALSH